VSEIARTDNAKESGESQMSTENAPREVPTENAPTENAPGQIQYRRCARNVIISGGAVIMFGLWGLLKSVFYYSLNRIDLVNLLAPELSESLRGQGAQVYRIVNTILFFMFLLIVNLGLPIRIYIGRSAAADARGVKKKSVIYIVLSALIGILLVAGFIRSFDAVPLSDIPEEVIRGMSPSDVINLTSAASCFVLTWYAIRLRIMRRELDKEGRRPYVA
jgi:hypothetical protein